MDQDKLTELEIKLAFQDKNVKELNAVIYEQQKRMDALEKTVKLMKDRMKALVEAESGQGIPDEKPPHY